MEHYQNSDHSVINDLPTVLSHIGWLHVFYLLSILIHISPHCRLKFMRPLFNHLSVCYLPFNFCLACSIAHSNPLQIYILLYACHSSYEIPCVNIYIYTCTHTLTHTYIYIYIHIYGIYITMYVYTYIYIYLFIYSCDHMGKYARVFLHMHTFMVCWHRHNPMIAKHGLDKDQPRLS